MKYLLMAIMMFTPMSVSVANTHQIKSERSISLTRDYLELFEGHAVNELTNVEIFEKIKEWLSGIFGPEVVDVLLELVGVKEFKDSLFSVYTNTRIVLNSSDFCPQAMVELSGELMYIATYVAVIYKVQIPPAASAAAVLARIASKEVMRLSTMNEVLCKVVHQ